MHIMYTVSVLMGCVLAIMRWSVVYRGGGPCPAICVLYKSLVPSAVWQLLYGNLQGVDNVDTSSYLEARQRKTLMLLYNHAYLYTIAVETRVNHRLSFFHYYTVPL